MSGNHVHRVAGLLCLGVISLVHGAGCDALNLAPLATATSTVAETFATGSAPVIVVETFNGSIDISDGKDSEVVVEVTKRASAFDNQAAEAALVDIEVSLIQKDNTIHVTARHGNRMSGNRGASVVIAAPKSARLELKSSNGSVVCEGLQGGIKSTTSNAKIEIVESLGTIDVVTSNGRIEIEAADAVVDAHTSNGPIKFSGSLADDDQQFKTSNGPIAIALPADSQFKFDGSTSNAGISSQFPLAAEPYKCRTRVMGVVGEDPACSITAATSNAPIQLRKARAAD